MPSDLRFFMANLSLAVFVSPLNQKETHTHSSCADDEPRPEITPAKETVRSVEILRLIRLASKGPYVPFRLDTHRERTIYRAETRSEWERAWDWEHSMRFVKGSNIMIVRR